MERIDGVVRTYHWGDAEYLPRMLGRQPDGTPHAELWFGAHPSAPCHLHDAGTSLEEATAADPLGVVGRPDGSFPLLAKVLAAAGPLSIQVHPDPEQARAGFAAEEAAGVPLDAPERTYRDPSAKPELVCALTPFTAKCGLRHPAATVELLRALDVPGLAALVDLLTGRGPDAARLRAALEWLFALDEGEVAGLVGRVVAAGPLPGSTFAAEAVWTSRLAEVYPGDVGVLVALLLNHVELAPGQALHLGAGNLHSYLDGVAVEVMAPSDNVVRGGLTSKHVDVAELLRLVDPTPITPAVQTPRGPVHDYEVDGRAFGLTRIDLDAAGRTTLRGPGVLVMTEGAGTVTRGARTLDLARGGAVLVRADDGPVELAGTGVVHHAHAA